MRLFLAAAFTLILSNLVAAQTCSSDKITCAEWCKKYAPTSQNCFSGGANSCDKKPNGNNSCVNDKCPSGRITCEGWCEKWNSKNLESCKFTSVAGCMKKYGTLLHCVGDGPPSR